MSSRKCNIVWGKTCAFYWELVGFVGLLKAYHRIYSYNKYRERLLRTGDFSGCIHLGHVSHVSLKMGISPNPNWIVGFICCPSDSQPFCVSQNVDPNTTKADFFQKPIGSMYAIYGNIYHQYTPNVSIYTIHGSYGKRTSTVWGSRTEIPPAASRTMWSTWVSPALQVVPNWKWCHWREAKWPFQPGGPGGQGGRGLIYWLIQIPGLVMSK